MTRETLPAEFKPKFLDHLDGRTQAARMLRRRLAELQADLGGEEQLSYAKRALCRRVIWLESFLETQEAKAAEGGEVNIGQQVQAINSLVGLLKALGLERRAREVPDLRQYLADKAAEKSEADQ